MERLLTVTTVGSTDGNAGSSPPCIYLCGNSLGLQPRRTSDRIRQYLDTWATQGVFGHFKPLEDSPLPTWLNVDDHVAKRIAPVVGALETEVAVMDTLTVNLHLLMASFYKPDSTRYKIILEGKAFPSDHYAVESQLRHHGLEVETAMVMIEPPSFDNPIISTEQILSTIDQHAESTALLLLPGIQFYTGQYFDIKTITAYAQSKGILVCWDLAHAAGNVPLRLHDWNVDFAAWCNYKYLNSGPGAIAGLFVHERHGKAHDISSPSFRNRLSGWWGSEKSSRFAMNNNFAPMAGAAGFQVSNPSALDITALGASLEVYEMTTMDALRKKSLQLTNYLEQLLLEGVPGEQLFGIITPSDPAQRGAQLSVRLESGLLDVVMEELERNGVVVDERRPDVIRVAPAPLYNSFTDVWEFVKVFKAALVVAKRARENGTASLKGTKELEQTT